MFNVQLNTELVPAEGTYPIQNGSVTLSHCEILDNDAVGCSTSVTIAESIAEQDPVEWLLRKRYKPVTGTDVLFDLVMGLRSKSMHSLHRCWLMLTEA